MKRPLIFRNVSPTIAIGHLAKRKMRKGLEQHLQKSTDCILQIFKHHISLIEGHLKMVDMVRKHTVEGTGNHKTICEIINRTKEMLSDSKYVSRNFVRPPACQCPLTPIYSSLEVYLSRLQVEPPNLRQKVPLGSSSVSMYPGYSPADHKYGQAAQEYGQAVAMIKQKGEEVPKHGDLEYQVGQGKGIKRPGFLEPNPSRLRKNEQNGGDAATDVARSQSQNGLGDTERTAQNEDKPNPDGSENGRQDQPGTKPTLDASGAISNDNTYFVIDIKPTPINLTALSPAAAKERSTKKKKDESIKKVSPPNKKQKTTHDGDLPTQPAVEAEKPAKKQKKKHDGELPAAPHELEDISQQVEARLREKGDKKKRDKEKKRKRDSNNSEAAQNEGLASETAPGPAMAQTEQGTTHKKKKMKSMGEAEGEQLADRTVNKKRKNEHSTDATEERREHKRSKKREKRTGNDIGAGN